MCKVVVGQLIEGVVHVHVLFEDDCLHILVPSLHVSLDVAVEDAPEKSFQGHASQHARQCLLAVGRIVGLVHLGIVDEGHRRVPKVGHVHVVLVETGRRRRYRRFVHLDDHFGSRQHRADHLFEDGKVVLVLVKQDLSLLATGKMGDVDVFAKRVPSGEVLVARGTGKSRLAVHPCDGRSLVIEDVDHVLDVVWFHPSGVDVSTRSHLESPVGKRLSEIHQLLGDQ